MANACLMGSLFQRDSFFYARSEEAAFHEVCDSSKWRCLRGSVYPDGYCALHVLSELARVGLFVAMFDSIGLCGNTVSGTVPSCIGQMSVASEWCAAVVVAHLAVDKSTRPKTSKW